MSIEASIFDALKGLVANRVYPDVAPAGAAKPYITYQATGGEAINFMDTALPGKRNCRMQINVWADTRKAASDLGRTVEDTVRVLPLNVTVLGAAISRFEVVDGKNLFGSQQDFSLWY